MDAGALYDIANVDAHPEFDPLTRGHLRIPPGHCPLDLHSAPQRIHGTDEQDQQAVTGRPYDPTAVFFNLRLDELSMMGVQLSECAFIVVTYQAAVTSYIRHQDGHKSAFDLLTDHG